MEIISLAVGALETNCYIVYEGDKAIVIDPGGDADTIIQQLSENSLSVEYIFNTHGHHDHVSANKEIALYAKKPVLVHPDDEHLLTMGFDFLGLPPAEKDYDTQDLVPGQCYEFGKTSIEVIHTPGHTKGSVSLLIGNNLFSGDLLFKNSVGRSDFADSSPEDLVKSLKKVFILDSLVAVYPGHGPATSIATEKENNPFILQLDL